MKSSTNISITKSSKRLPGYNKKPSFQALTKTKMLIRQKMRKNKIRMRTSLINKDGNIRKMRIRIKEMKVILKNDLSDKLRYFYIFLNN